MTTPAQQKKRVTSGGVCQWCGTEGIDGRRTYCDATHKRLHKDYLKECEDLELNPTSFPGRSGLSYSDEDDIPVTRVSQATSVSSTPPSVETVADEDEAEDDIIGPPPLKVASDPRPARPVTPQEASHSPMEAPASAAYAHPSWRVYDDLIYDPKVFQAGTTWMEVDLFDGDFSREFDGFDAPQWVTIISNLLQPPPVVQMIEYLRAQYGPGAYQIRLLKPNRAGESVPARAPFLLVVPDPRLPHFAADAAGAVSMNRRRMPNNAPHSAFDGAFVHPSPGASAATAAFSSNVIDHLANDASETKRLLHQEQKDRADRLERELRDLREMQRDQPGPNFALEREIASIREELRDVGRARDASFEASRKDQKDAERLRIEKETEMERMRLEAEEKRTRMRIEEEKLKDAREARQTQQFSQLASSLDMTGTVSSLMDGFKSTFEMVMGQLGGQFQGVIAGINHQAELNRKDMQLLIERITQKSEPGPNPIIEIIRDDRDNLRTELSAQRREHQELINKLISGEVGGRKGAGGGGDSLDQALTSLKKLEEFKELLGGGKEEKEEIEEPASLVPEPGSISAFFKGISEAAEAFKPITTAVAARIQNPKGNHENLRIPDLAPPAGQYAPTAYAHPVAPAMAPAQITSPQIVTGSQSVRGNTGWQQQPSAPQPSAPQPQPDAPRSEGAVEQDEVQALMRRIEQAAMANTNPDEILKSITEVQRMMLLNVPADEVVQTIQSLSQSEILRTNRGKTWLKRAMRRLHA